MTISTKVLFYYIDEVDDTNFNLAFNEGSGELTAQLRPGSYAPQELMIETARAMNAAGTLTYTVTLNRVSRLVTIAGSAAFDLLISSGSTSGTSVFGLLGFSGADQTSLLTYDGSAKIGTAYKPQFLPQSSIGDGFKRKNVSGVKRKSASGLAESVTYGRINYLEMNFKYITNVKQGKSAPIDNNPNAISEAIAFLDAITLLPNIEFMKDRSDPNTYITLLLESTARSRSGIDYELKSMMASGLFDYYETGKLEFSKVE